MASEPFEATDANGITVRGGVELSRDPKGDFHDPASPHYGNPRYAEFHIVYSNTREACTIDQATLSEAVQTALGEALKKFGIPGADPRSMEKRVNAEIDANRQRCIANADKYVSNETYFAPDGAFGNSVADQAVVSPGGMMRQAAVGDKWRASNSDGSLISNVRSDAEGSPPTADRQPVRYLSSRVAGKSVPSGFPVEISTPPLVPSGEMFNPRQAMIGNPLGGWMESVPAASRSSSQPHAPLLGLVSGKPMSFYPVQPPIFDIPEQATPDREDWLMKLLTPRGRG